MSELARFEPDEEGGMVPVRPGEVISIGEWVRAEDAEEAIVALKTKLADLEASQARWVKCSERLPTKKEGEYFCVIQGRILDEVHTDFCIGGLSDSGDLLPTEPVAPQWKIIAWLENVPEYKP